MKTILFLFLGSNNKSETVSLVITIEGNINGVLEGKIYLVESKKCKTPIDSTNIKNRHFQFSKKIDSPILATIHYWDSSM